MKIKSARITAMPRPMPEGMFDAMPQVHVVLEDGSEQMLFEYYPNEISFEAEEFIGLTIKEARSLKTIKDIKFLQTK